MCAARLVRFWRYTWEIASLVLCYRRPSRVVSGFSFWANTFSLGDLRLNRLDVVSCLFYHSHASISRGVQKYHVWHPPFSNYENLGLTDRCMFVDFVRSTPSSVVMPWRSWGTTSWQRTRRASPSSGCHIFAHNVDIVECGMNSEGNKSCFPVQRFSLKPMSWNENYFFASVSEIWIASVDGFEVSQTKSDQQVKTLADAGEMAVHLELVGSRLKG